MREAEERITKTVEKISISIVPNLHPLNQILYGAPGTGKTYNTINHALAIIENKPIAEYDNMNRADLKKTFDDYVENKQIAFVTFHQSLSYEDFIEGLKPKSEGNNISYAVEDGIFKQMAKNASDDIKAVVTHKYHNFEEAYQKLISRLPLTLKTTSDDVPFKLESRSENSLAVLPSKNENSKERIISKDKIQGYFKGQEEVSSPSYVRAIAQYLVNDCGYIVLPNNYVLIIDEINRGNVAQIFGELITLIEQSKRQEATEAINLTLPYSKEAFGVPQNLYIIGTMNTADRSVEALDTALRRRFDFVEMQPKPEILAGKMSEICLKTVLTNLNARIAYLLDSDHAIGHAYFMDVDNADKLAQVFEHKIVPLLREYFYNDYEKIQMILGEDFVQSKSDMPKFAGKKNPQKKATYHFLQVQADNIIAALKTAGLDE
jgi:5-methylcytosine-specific restriction protein B